MPRVIDMHQHAPLGPGEIRSPQNLLNVMDSLNVEFSVLTGTPDYLEAWTNKSSDRFVPSLLLPCENGKAPNGGRECFQNDRTFPDLSWLRGEIEKGNIKMLGEIVTQYLGLFPNDQKLEPYLDLAEEYDIPVAIHVGPGPPAAAYSSSPVPQKSPNYRAAAGNPMELEEMLLKHKNLRVSVMHAGWPMLDEMISILYHHPNVYVETGVLQWAIPREEYYRYLKRLVQAGYSDRILFGSDGRLAQGIEAIMSADFLTEQQKDDILYNNASKFLEIDS
ncbi:MAG: amidohydrolase family protein [Candidatus Cyclobacteriaceae bacterium M2_1C_046]